MQRLNNMVISPLELVKRGNTVIFTPKGITQHLAVLLQKNGIWPAIADDHETCAILLRLWPTLAQSPVTAIVQQPLLVHGVRFSDLDAILFIGPLGEPGTNEHAICLQSLNRGGPDTKLYLLSEEQYRDNYMG